MSWLSDLWKGFIDWLMPTPDPAGVFVTKTGTNQHIPVVYGEQRVSGITVFKRSSDRSGGPWNDYLHLVIVLCEGEVDSIGTVYFNGVSQYDSRWGSEWYHIEKFTGADNQPVCSTLVNHRVGWSNSDKLSGLAYLYVRLRQNKEVNKWRGEPEITCIVKGKKVKNLDTNITEYSTVPAYCIADYLTRPRYGKGASEVILDIPSFVASANFTNPTVTATEDQIIDNIRTIQQLHPNWRDVDWSKGADTWDLLGLDGLFEQSTNQASVSQPLMSCNVTLDTSQTIFENLKIMLAGIRGMIPNTTGKIKLVHETTASSIFDFDSTNIIGGIEAELKGRKDKANQITLSFHNKALNYEMDSVVFPETGSTLHNQWLAEDYNVDLPDEVEMKTINNKAEALQMVEIIARLSRDFINISFTGDATARAVEPSDVVSITDEDYGWDQKPFRILSYSDGPNNTRKYTAIEYQNIFPWVDRTYVQDYPKTTLGDPFDLFPPTGVTSFADEGIVKISWFLSPDQTVKGYVVDIYDAVTDVLIKTETTKDNFVVLRDLPTGDYDAKVYAISDLGVSISSDVSFTVALNVYRLKYADDNYNSMVFTPNDYRVVPYINAVHFYYSETDYGATPDTVNAENGGVGLNCTISTPVGGTVYYVWYGDGVTWYKTSVILDSDVSVRYYIRYPNGQSITTEAGTVIAEARIVNQAGDNLLPSGGDPQLYIDDIAAGNLIELARDDIDGSVLVTLKNGVTVLDAVTLSDIVDATNVVIGSFGSPSNGLSWVQAPNNGSWSPSGTTTTLTATFYRSGEVIATRTLTMTLNTGTGNITAAYDSATGDATTHNVTGGGTKALTLTVTHTDSNSSVSESIVSIQGGAQGSQGEQGEQGEPGEQGAQGEQGEDGPRSAGQYELEVGGTDWGNATYSTYTGGDNIADWVTPGDNVLVDTVTLHNSTEGSEWSTTKSWDGTNWVTIQRVVDAVTLYNAPQFFLNLTADSIDASFLNVTTLNVADLNVAEANWGANVQIYESGVTVPDGPVGTALIYANVTNTTNQVGMYIDGGVTSTAIYAEGGIKAGGSITSSSGLYGNQIISYGGLTVANKGRIDRGLAVESVNYNNIIIGAGGALDHVWDEQTDSQAFIAGGDVLVKGTVTATNHINSSSDKRLKNSIVPIDNPLERLDLMPTGGVFYERNNQKGKLYAHILAQELLAALGEPAVETDKDGFLLVNHDAELGLLFAVVKELRQQNLDQQHQIEKLTRIING